MAEKKNVLFVIDRSKSMKLVKEDILDKSFVDLDPSLESNVSFVMFSNRIKTSDKYLSSLKVKGRTNIKRLFKYLSKDGSISPSTNIFFVSDALFSSRRWEKQYLKMLKNKNFINSNKYAVGVDIFSYEQEKTLSLLTLNQDSVFTACSSNQFTYIVKTILDHSSNQESPKEIHKIIFKNLKYVDK